MQRKKSIEHICYTFRSSTYEKDCIYHESDSIFMAFLPLESALEVEAWFRPRILWNFDLKVHKYSGPYQ